MRAIATYDVAMATPEFLVEARTTLEQMRTELVARNEELSVTANDPLAYDDNFADSAQVTAELSENQLAVAANNEHIEDVDLALARIDAGEYGVCEECGEPIREARLEALPTTRYCIEHA